MGGSLGIEKEKRLTIKNTLIMKTLSELLAKFIPFEIRVKTLYWVRKEKEIDADLTNLFAIIDSEEYEQGRILLNELKTKWTEISFRSPKWFLDCTSKFSKAEAMLDFLE